MARAKMQPLTQEQVLAIREFLKQQKYTREQWSEAYQSWALSGHAWNRLQSGGTDIQRALTWYQFIHKPGSKEWRPAIIIRALLQTAFSSTQTAEPTPFTPTAKQLHILRHALGLDYAKKEYRNHYIARPKTTNWNDCRILTEKGLMVDTGPHGQYSRGTRCFSVTDAGRAIIRQEEKKGMFVVTLPNCPDGPCYLCKGQGDPPRTYDRSRAREFKSRGGAQRAINKAKQTHPLQERHYEIISAAT